MQKGHHLPAWMVMPRDRPLRAKATGDEYDDPGNQVWEALFWTAGLEKLVNHSLDHYMLVTACPNAPYGSATNKSAKGPVNMRGNLIEALLRWLFQQQQQERQRR